MNLIFQKARNLMVENQLRPNKINTPEILKVFLDIKKEDFLSNKLRNLAYSDIDINLIYKRGYLKNLHNAQLIQYSKINIKDKVLHIGALTGYITCLLSKLSAQVIAIEKDIYLFKQLNQNINYLKLNNVEVYNNDLNSGFLDQSPYDLIFIDNPITKLSNKILDQLNDNNGRLIMIEKIREDLGKGILITKNKKNYNKEILFDVFSKFELYKNEDEFVF